MRSMVPYYTMQKRPQFLMTSNEAKRFVTPAFIVLASGMAGKNQPYKKGSPVISDTDTAVCFGYTASKKVGNAIARAKAKRRMRAVVDNLVRLNPEFALPDNNKKLNIVLIARAYTLNRDFGKMTRELKNVLETDLNCTCVTS
jgi:ribonuclease P protein component